MSLTHARLAMYRWSYQSIRIHLCTQLLCRVIWYLIKIIQTSIPHYIMNFMWIMEILVVVIFIWTQFWTYVVIHNLGLTSRGDKQAWSPHLGPSHKIPQKNGVRRDEHSIGRVPKTLVRPAQKCGERGLPRHCTFYA